ncbi:hypothetical protein [Poriferisphaera sp. WC338]|uniref:hypothetical protein n=1 Tax=Poriferisphaera sp. WC338 TaxID=3425129 RepID=UPI003D817BF8
MSNAIKEEQPSGEIAGFDKGGNKTRRLPVYDEPTVKPRQLSWWVAILFAPVAPFYVIGREERLPIWAALIYVLVVTVLLVPAATVLCNVLGYARGGMDAWRLAGSIYDWFFSVEPTVILPPIVWFGVISLLAVALVGFVFLPRMAKPRETIRSAYPSALRRVCLIYPAIFVTITMFAFGLQAIFYFQHQHFNYAYNQWMIMHPYPQSSNGVQPSAQAMKDWNDAFNQFHTDYYNSRSVTAVSMEEWLQNHADKLVFVLFLLAVLAILFLLRMVSKQMMMRPRSHWPATCEGCGYNIFTPVSRNAITSEDDHVNALETYQGNSICTECGELIEMSIPSNHRIDDPTRRADTWYRRISKLWDLTILFLFKPKVLSRQIRIHDPSMHHHWVARLVLWLLIPITVFCVVVGIVHDYLLWAGIDHFFVAWSWERLTREWEAYPIIVLVSVSVAYLVIQLLAMMGMVTLSLSKAPNPHFAMKVANLASGPLMVLAVVTYVLNISAYYVFDALPRSFYQMFPRDFRGPEIFVMAFVIASSIFALSWLFFSARRVLHYTRYANA